MRETGLEQDLDEPGRDAGRLLRGLEHDGVAGHQCRRHHAGGDREREVPGRDDDADAARLVPVLVRLTRRLQQRRARTELDRAPAVVLAEVDRFADVCVGFGKGLARFEHAQRREFIAAPAHLIGGPEQDSGAFAPRRRAPFRPGVHGGRNGSGDVLESGGRTAAHRDVGPARIDRHDGRAGVDGGAVDEQRNREPELAFHAVDGLAELVADLFARATRPAAR